MAAKSQEEVRAAVESDKLSEQVGKLQQGITESRQLRKSKWTIMIGSGIVAGLVFFLSFLGLVTWYPPFSEQQEAENIHNRQSNHIVGKLAASDRQNKRLLIEIECLLGVQPEQRSNEQIRECRAEATRRVPEPEVRGDGSPR